MSRISSGSQAASGIRGAQESDALALSLLLGELGYPTTPAGARERINATLRDPHSSLLVAVLDCEVVGFASAVLLPYFPTGTQVLRITGLGVAQHAQRHGVGSALVQHIAGLGGSTEVSGVEVTTAESRADAHAFYERLGFQRTSIRFFLSAAP